MPVLIEVCVDSVPSALAAQRGGAARVELCSGLAEGGLTPSSGLISAVRDSISIALHVIIRPRGGDFLYEDHELDIMRRDIALCKQLGVDGVVLGILHPDGSVNIEQTREIVTLARPMSLAFHRAFDMTNNLSRALEDLVSAGVDRVLTSGGEQRCMDALDVLAQLVNQSRTAGASGTEKSAESRDENPLDRIIVMAGGGIRSENAATIVSRTGAREIHVGMSTVFESAMKFRNPRVTFGKPLASEYQRSQVVEEAIRNLRRALEPNTT